MIDQSSIITLGERHIATIRLHVPAAEIRQHMGAAYGELMNVVNAQGIAAGSWFTHHFHAPGAMFDFEIGIPVSQPVQANGRVLPGIWPGMKVAHTIYRGPYEGLGNAWGEFQRWISTEGLQTADDLWECYAAGPETGNDPAGWRTEFYKPLR